MLAPKRKTLSKSEAIARANKLHDFLAKPEVKEVIQEIRPHKRVSWIRSEFAKETDISMPISSIYKLLREMETQTEPAPEKVPETKTDE